MGEEVIDLSSVPTIVEHSQTLAIAWGLYKIRELGMLKENPGICEVARYLDSLIEDKGLRVLDTDLFHPLTKPRIFEVVAAINRLRGLSILLED